MVDRVERATTEEIAAAWGAWQSRHGGKLGPGPAFAEAIGAALAIRRRAVLEEAAKVAEKHFDLRHADKARFASLSIASAIRALSQGEQG